jgi:hypothetical protein
MINGYDIIINTRLDIFTLPYNNLDFNNREKYLNMVEECILNKCDIKFMYKQNNIGIDNYYLGKSECIKNIASDFNYNLDSILEYIDPYQEKTVYIHAHKLFDNIQ